MDLIDDSELTRRVMVARSRFIITSVLGCSNRL